MSRSYIQRGPSGEILIFVLLGGETWHIPTSICDYANFISVLSLFTVSNGNLTIHVLCHRLIDDYWAFRSIWLYNPTCAPWSTPIAIMNKEEQDSIQHVWSTPLWQRLWVSAHDLQRCPSVIKLRDVEITAHHPYPLSHIKRCDNGRLCLPYKDHE